MTERQYNLILNMAPDGGGCVSSPDAQLLRDIGKRYVQNVQHFDDLVLMSPCGGEVERFDIWTGEWHLEDDPSE